MKRLIYLLVFALPSIAIAQTADAVSLGSWISQAAGVVADFMSSTITWQVRAAAVIALIISSMKVSFLNNLIWSKLGGLQIWLAPVLGFLAGCLTVMSGGSWDALWTYTVAGGGAIFVHELLDLIKLIPGLGPMWTAAISFVESCLGCPAAQSNKEGTVDGSQLLAIAEKFLDGVVMAVAQGVWAEVLVAVPALGVPVIGPILSGAFFWMISFLVGKSEKFANFLIIGYNVQAEKTTYDGKKAALQAALQSGDTNAIQKANDDYDKAFDALVHNDTAVDTAP